MTRKSFQLPEELHEYVVEKGTPPDEILKDLERETLSLGEISKMQIAPEQGAFMQFLVQLLKPKFCVEIGTFTGYSAICIARALPPSGRLLCCDVSEDWTTIAQKYWRRAGLESLIQLEVAPALETLEQLPTDQKIDFAFIDADKENYSNYFEAIFSRLDPNGVILVDNVLWNGSVINDEVQDSHTQSIRNFNDHISNDKRVFNVLLPIADGLMLVAHAK